jgi:hypothetical protein
MRASIFTYGLTNLIKTSERNVDVIEEHARGEVRKRRMGAGGGESTRSGTPVDGARMNAGRSIR